MPKLFLATSFFLFFLSTAIYGQDFTQSQGKILEVYNISKTTYNNGDTIFVRIRNLTPHDRGFTIEAVALNKEPYYYNAVYSAYLNKDTSFFKKLRMSKKVSKEKNIQYILPDYKPFPYDIKGNSEKTIYFITKGNLIQKGVLIKLRIMSDIVNNDYETIYSNPFKIFSLPD